MAAGMGKRPDGMEWFSERMGGKGEQQGLMEIWWWIFKESQGGRGWTKWGEHRRERSGEWRKSVRGSWGLRGDKWRVW